MQIQIFEQKEELELKARSVFPKKQACRPAVLKLGVATLLRVAKCPKRGTKFEAEEKFGLLCIKQAKN
jgi:hypothetical protein